MVSLAHETSGSVSRCYVRSAGGESRRPREYGIQFEGRSGAVHKSTESVLQVTAKMTWYQAAEILGITEPAHAALTGECFQEKRKNTGLHTCAFY
jgi:hypothetical protein